MKQWWQYYSRWIVLLILPILSGMGCLGTDGANPTSSPLPAYLAALRVTVELVRQDQPRVQVLENQPPIGIQEGDKIFVNPNGWGLLKFPDGLLVEVLRDTELQLDNARLEPGASIFVRLRQIVGHSLVDMDAASGSRVRVRESGQIGWVSARPDHLSCNVLVADLPVSQ